MDPSKRERQRLLEMLSPQEKEIYQRLAKGLPATDPIPRRTDLPLLRDEAAGDKIAEQTRLAEIRSASHREIRRMGADKQGTNPQPEVAT